MAGRVVGHLPEHARNKEKGFPVINRKPLVLLVGAKGFEPSTPCTPCKCATRLRHAPTARIITKEATAIALPAANSTSPTEVREHAEIR